MEIPIIIMLTFIYISVFYNFKLTKSNVGIKMINKTMLRHRNSETQGSRHMQV